MTPQEKQAVRMKTKKVRSKLRKGLESGVDKFAKMGGRKAGGSNKAGGGKELNGKGKKGREKAEKKEALRSVVKTGKGVTVVGKGSGKK
jgi:U3 small nucleolar RNA-associated protein MPP10